jgi:hypothetical protein
MRKTVLCHRNLGIQNAFCHVNLERFNEKSGNVSENYTNTKRSLSQEFGQAVMRNTVMCHWNSGIQNTVSRKNLERCNAKYGNVSEEFRNIECSCQRN